MSQNRYNCSVSLLAHVPALRLEIRIMVGSVPKTKLKLSGMSKQSIGLRFVFNPPNATEDRT